MLNTKEIGHYIEHPAMVSYNGIEDLKALSNKYPYSQVFSILLLLAMKSANDVRFEEELKLHSFRISDRRRLFDLIYSEVESEVPEMIQEEAERNQTESDITIVKDNEPEPELTEQETEDEVVSKLKDQQDALELTILHNSLAVNYQLDELTDEEEKALEDRQKKDEIVVEDQLVQIEDRDTQNQSFTSWLHADINYAEEDRSDKEAINAVVESFSDFNPTEDLFGEVQKPKADFFSPTKKAKQSLDESKLPVSETLAKIYALQGNYPKAIEAYEQLSLKYPEKKTFFALLIEDLKKQLNK